MKQECKRHRWRVGSSNGELILTGQERFELRYGNDWKLIGI